MEIQDAPNAAVVEAAYDPGLAIVPVTPSAPALDTSTTSLALLNSPGATISPSTHNVGTPPALDSPEERRQQLALVAQHQQQAFQG